MTRASNQAFPREGQPGMTLREYFAGQALAGIAHELLFVDDVTHEQATIEKVADYADRLATALVNRLNRSVS